MTIPLVILASPLFPNVPNLPGVPPVARMLGTEAVAAVAMLDPSLATAIFGGVAAEQWGIVDKSRNFVINPQSFVRMEVDDAYHVSDYPVEQGEFASYNKVKIPTAGTVTLSQGGNVSARRDFLIAAKSIEKSLTPYYIEVPEGSYGPVTIDRVSYERRASGGANFILAHIHFTEIRITPPVQYGHPQPTSAVPPSAVTSATTSTGIPNPTQTTSPTAFAMQSIGPVGASAPTPGVQSAINNYTTPPSNW